MSDVNADKLKDAATNFISNDFGQIFSQARHYDSQIYDIFKYLVTTYLTVAAAAIGLYKFDIEQLGIDLQGALIVGLSIALLFGLFLLPTVIRNRVYFVVCMRYINEQRKYFLENNAIGFPNQVRMYSNYKNPPYFNYFSSQSGWIYLHTLLNTALLGIIYYIAEFPLAVNVVVCVFVLILQLVLAITYLTSREGKSVGEAVFGKE